MQGKESLLKSFNYGELIRPLYSKGSTVNLISSISKVCGVTPLHPGLDNGFEQELSQASHIIFILIDALGSHLLENLSQNGFFMTHLRSKMRTVFPSTTAAALTTIASGLSPAEHGIFSWFLYLREVGIVTTILPFIPRIGGLPLSRAGTFDPGYIFKSKPWLKDAKREVFYVSPHVYSDSDFARFASGGRKVIPYSSWEDGLQKVVEKIKNCKDKSYSYIYIPDVDTMSHAKGCRHPDVLAELRKLEKALEKMSDELKDKGVIFIITGDHGQIDIPRDKCINLNLNPEFLSLLTLPLTGEPRVPFLYVRLSRQKKFLQLTESLFSKTHFLLDMEEVIDLGLLGGERRRTPFILERLGDYILIPKIPAVVHDFLPGQGYFFLTGYHGGLSPDEMEVPLIVYSQ